MSEATTKKKSTYNAKKLKYTEQYHKEKMTQFNLRFNNEIDADILEHLAKQPNKRQYIINLIREDIAREREK